MPNTLGSWRGVTLAEVHPYQASPAHAVAAFGFLAALGFACVERFVTGGVSFRDGWRLTYESVELQVAVQYIDVQFEVHFRRGGLDASYLFLDRELFSRRSGFGGDMFPRQKLGPAIDRIANDIRDNYGDVLAASPEVWRRIRQQLEAPTTRGPRLP